MISTTFGRNVQPQPSLPPQKAGFSCKDRIVCVFSWGERTLLHSNSFTSSARSYRKVHLPSVIVGKGGVARGAVLFLVCFLSLSLGTAPEAWREAGRDQYMQTRWPMHKPKGQLKNQYFPQVYLSPPGFGRQRHSRVHLIDEGSERSARSLAPSWWEKYWDGNSGSYFSRLLPRNRQQITSSLQGTEYERMASAALTSRTDSA